MSGTHECVRLLRGSLYFSAQQYSKYFQGIESVALLHDPACVRVLPLRQPGAGGLLLKIRNAQGDRVVHALEFCRQHGLESDEARELPARWDSQVCALVVDTQSDA